MWVKKIAIAPFSRNRFKNVKNILAIPFCTRKGIIKDDKEKKSILAIPTMLNLAISRSASRVAAARTVSRGISPLAQCFLPSRSFSVQPKKEEKKEEKKEDGIKSLSDEVLMKRKALADLPITFSDISRAKVAINGGVVRTECIKSYFLSELTGANIYIKPEIRQFTGSFKERGARNAIMQVQREMKGALKGVIAASAGNHALALAYHGKELGVPATVVMPVVAPLAKVDKCRVSNLISTTTVFSMLFARLTLRRLIITEIRCSHHHPWGPHWRGERIRGDSCRKGRPHLHQWIRRSGNLCWCWNHWNGNY